MVAIGGGLLGALGQHVVDKVVEGVDGAEECSAQVGQEQFVGGAIGTVAASCTSAGTSSPAGRCCRCSEPGQYCRRVGIVPTARRRRRSKVDGGLHQKLPQVVPQSLPRAAVASGGGGAGGGGGQNQARIAAGHLHRHIIIVVIVVIIDVVISIVVLMTDPVRRPAQPTRSVGFDKAILQTVGGEGRQHDEGRQDEAVRGRTFGHDGLLVRVFLATLFVPDFITSAKTDTTLATERKTHGR